MANLKLDNKWNDGFYQLETTDPVMGGEDGIDNLQAKQLGANIFYIRGKGIAEWANNITYSKHSLVNVNGELYISLVDNNLNIAITDSTKWAKLIKQATTLASGIVKLNNTTNSASTTEAATANAVKVTMEKANSAETAAGNAQNTANTAKSTAETDASTNVKGRVQLNSAINSTAENQAATPGAVKKACDLANRRLPLAGGTVTGNTNFTGKLQQAGKDVITTGNVVSYIGKSYVTETYRSSDGTSWYRKWSDGFIEQGGVTGNLTINETVVNLLTPMSTANYIINLQVVTNTGANEFFNPVFNKTTSSFSTKLRGYNGSQISNAKSTWLVTGY